MVRYFSSILSARPLETGGRSFVFEPVQPMGGGWLGVLAEADEVSASILAACESVSEISEADYDRLKKKLKVTVTSPVSRPSPRQPQGAQRLAAVVAPAAVRPNSTGAETVQGPMAPAAPEPAGPSVELKMTDKEPPAEPLLDITPKRKSKKKGAS